MSSRNIKTSCFALIGILLYTTLSYAQVAIQESHRKVAMRMIGHQVLLHLGDSTSLVLPIESDGQQYKIKFATEIAFDPETLAQVIDEVVSTKQLAQHYIVEILNVDTNEIVYSYEVGYPKTDLIPCQGRQQPKSYYQVLFRILDPEVPVLGRDKAKYKGLISEIQPPKLLNVNSLLVGFVLILLFLTVLFWKRHQKDQQNTHLISIGAYKFDMRNMELLLQKERFELTSKEADLLFLLYNSANTTIDRDTILKKVWGDEGGYVGRTLDVYISKLRKKLDADTNVKIINIRGFGYKLVIN